MLRLILSKRFQKDLKKVKDKKLQERVKKIVSKIMETPGAGKHLRYNFKGCQSLRIRPFRIIYKVRDDCLYFVKLEHRDEAYKKR